MSRSGGVALRRAALLVGAIFILSIAVPPGAIPAGGTFPLGWLSWFVQPPAWSAAAEAFAGLPVQQRGLATGRDHHVPAEATRAPGGSGRAPEPAADTLAPYRPHEVATTPTTTGAAPRFDPQTSVRVPSAATARSDVYANADGTYTRRTYSRPVNYQAADGSWQPIDPTLVRRAGGRLHMKANSLQVSVAATEARTDLASMTLPSGEALAFDLAGGAAVTPVVHGPTATYRDVLPQTDLELSTFDAGIKETLILRSPDAPSSWVFPLRLQGLTPQLTDAGWVELRNADGKAVAWLPRGYMEDSKVDPRSGAAAQGNVTFEIITVNGAPALRVVADQAWLRDPARVFPVRVDPTATTGTTGDVYVDNYSGTTNHNGDSLPVGTYDGGTVKARSFIHFDEFDDNGFMGKRITGARLKAYLTWTYDCNTHKPFYVHRVTQAWTVADLSTAGYPGPTISSSIGSLTVSDNYPACLNSSADRSVGKWVSVPLNVSTFNDWSTGGMNEGVALTASETDSYAWKRFTSANYGGGAYKAYLELDYANNVAPQVDVRYPANNAVLPTLTPELLVRAKDPDVWPNKGLKYNFAVYDATGTSVVANSGWISATSWTVPAAKLTWNKSYLYAVQVYDTVSYSAVYPAYAFTTSVPQPLVTANLAQNAGKGFDPSIGNYTTSATDASVATVGPSLSITRSYNSLDTRRSGAFGTGWSSVLDVRATQVKDAAGTVQSVLITYPTGQDVAFGRNVDGTFTAPSGRFSVLKETTDAGGTLTGYTLTDKDATVYTFGRSIGSGVYKVTSIADASGRALTFAYDAANNATTMTSTASGRALHLTWVTPSTAIYPHVATISSDPSVPGDPGSVNTWQYQYGTYDKLTGVCPPTDPTRCTTYLHDWTSSVASTVLNAGPYSYWRFNEAAGATTAKSSVLANAGVDSARYSNVTLGQPAAFANSTATSAAFNGTSSYVQLPGKLVADGQYQSISMWFKTTTANGVLFSYSIDPITKGTTASGYTPALYIGSDGKLRGQFWQGSATPIVSDVAVTDGAWHHVVLAGAGDTQTLYLDGAAKGTLAGTIAQVPGQSTNVHVGAGFVGHGWPNHLRSGASPAVATYFTGSISDVAFFNETLSASTVSKLRSSGTSSHSVLYKVSRPLGGVTAQITYDKVTGKVATVMDENGGVWTMGTPSVAGSSDVYAASVLGAKPADYWRLGEVSVTDAINEVQGGTAVYNSVTLGAAGPFSDSKAASFSGTSSYLQLPSDDVPTTGPNSVEMWFKMPSGSTAGGTLFGFQTNEMSGGAISGNWVPALYIGVDGKLRGKWCWCGNANPPITTAAALNDGKWHHVALTLGTNVQKLYLDGVAVGTLNLASETTTAQYAYIGAGFNKSWPSASASGLGYFPGSIAEVAFYSSQLSDAQVTAHFQASKQTAPVAMTMVSGVATAISMPVSNVEVTGPTGEKLSYSYDLVNGNRIVAQTDALGNTTKFGYDVGGYGNLVYDPRGVWTQELQDVRGNTKQTITCQDQAANKCSSVYYTYYPDATTTNLTPDARNDLVLTMRDARSASEADNTYLTTYGYDAKGNRTTITDPLGRVTTTGYTDGTTVAAYDGGYAPPGLPSTVVTPGGAKQTVVYYANGDVAQVTEPGGKTIRYAYDGVGRVLTETEITDTFPDGLTTTYAYDQLGREVSQTDPAATNRVTGAVHTARTTTVYDPDGNVLEETVTDTTGGDAARTETHVYNGYGQETASTDAAGATTSFEYDLYGRVVKETEPDGGVTRNTYDAEGNLLTSTVVGFTGDPNSPSPPQDLVTVSKAYDPTGRLASETDAMGWTTSYTYTDNGLEVRTVRSDGTNSFVLEENTYDTAGNVVRQVTNNGATTTTSIYDAAGRQTSSTIDPGGLNRTTTLTYDADDNVISTTQSGPSGVVGVSDAMYDSMGHAVAETTYTSTALTPVGRWKLDEGSGTTAADASGNSPGTASGGVTWSTERGGSAVFNGTDAVIKTAGPAVDTARAHSLAVWVKLAAETADGFAIVIPGAIGNSAMKLAYSAAGDQWYVSMSVRNADGTNSWIGGGSPVGLPQAGTWTHLAVTVEPSTGTVKLYVNGALQATITSTKAFNNRATGMHIGSEYGTGWFNGQIDDVQAYQKALSAAEVSQIYGGTAPAADAQVIRTSLTLDQDGLAKSSTDPNGISTYTSYDEEGRAVKTTAPAAMAETATAGATLANAVSWVGYNTFGEMTGTKDANGNWSVTGYDAAGRVVSERLPSYTPPGSTTAMTPETTRGYDAIGQLTSVTDALGNRTSYTYDQLGRVAKVTAPNLGATRYTYDHVGDVLSVTDPAGAVSTSTYDYLGRQLTSTEVVRQAGTNYTTTYTYNPGGWLSQVRSPSAVTTTTSYNAVGEPVTVKDGANNTTTYAYDADGQPVRATLPDGSYSTTTYDLAGRGTATASYNSAGTLLSSESSRYDRAGNVVAGTDARGTTTTFSYDATGVLTKEVQPISGSDAIQTTFGYDLAGNRTRLTDGRGNTFWTTYNSWSLPESQVEPATAAHSALADRTFTVAYDQLGQPVSQALPGGVSITSTYDVMGQLTRQVGAGAEAATGDRVFGYDLAGRMTSLSGPGGTNTFAYDDRDLLLSVSGPSGNSSFAYDSDGQAASRTDAAGSTSYTYDGAGRLATAANSTAGMQLSFTYDTLSQVSKITYGSSGNTRNFAFDDQHRPIADELKTPSGASIAKIAYGWDANDNLTAKTTTGFAGAAANSYTYDLADRLTSWNNGTSTTVYAYDKSGNRVQNGAQLFTYDARNRLLAADGVSYAYTARGTLASAGGQSTTVDAFGQVISQQSQAGTQTYSYDGLGRAIRPGFAYTGVGNDLAGDGAATYVRGPSGEVLGEAVGGIQRLAWTDLHTDVVGQFTATGTSLAGSTSYDPLGKVLATSGMLGNLGYQSEWTDSLTNRVNMHARWYNVGTGQFDTRDTVGNNPVPDSINANRYQYGDANPLTVTDPTGHWGSWFKSRVSSAWNSARSYTSRAWSSVSSYASRSYSYAREWASEKYYMTRSYAARKYHQVKRAVKKKYHQVKRAVKKKYNQVKRAVKKKIQQGRKWVAKKYSQAKKKVKHAWNKAKQAGKKITAKATRVVKKAASHVKDAYQASKKWVKEHKDVLLEVAAIGGAILAGLACTAVTAGAGAVACMVGAGALINLAKDTAQGDIHSVGDALGSMGTGALAGLAGGAGGMVASRVAAAVGSKVGTGVMGRLATEAVENGIGGAFDQVLTTGRFDAKNSLMDMVPGLGLLNRKGGGTSAAKPGGGGGVAAGESCSLPGIRHSFDPATKVLMADGTARPIEDVNVGDKVAATDPQTGRTEDKSVVQLHRNTDRDLMDLTVRDQEGKVTTLNTTQHHPFYNESQGKWTDAKDLTPGTKLRVVDAGSATVVAVSNRIGEKEMRDLTVADIHTYYVLADDDPVLVHNCGGYRGRHRGEGNADEWPEGYEPKRDANPKHHAKRGPTEKLWKYMQGGTDAYKSYSTWMDGVGKAIAPFADRTWGSAIDMVGRVGSILFGGRRGYRTYEPGQAARHGDYTPKHRAPPPDIPESGWRRWFP